MGASAALGAAAGVSILPRHVLGGPNHPAPSETATYAIIGNGRRSDAGIGCLGDRKLIAVCGVDKKHGSSGGRAGCG